MNDLQAISCSQRNLVPASTGDDLSVPFNGDAIWFQTAVHKEVLQDMRRCIAYFNSLPI